MAEGVSNDELVQAEELGKIKAEVHTLNTLVKAHFAKFDQLVERLQPKPMGVAGYIGIALSILSILALIFGSMIYMTSSANAPVVTQMTQMTQILATIQNNTMQNANQGQLLSKELSGIEKSVSSNEETLRWIIFRENLPKQITEAQGRLNTLEMQMNRVVNQIHLKQKGNND